MRTDYPVTLAIRTLKTAGIAFVPHLYDYVEKGGTEASSAALGVSEHAVIKTLIMEDETRAPLIVLMHGDRQVSTKTLARFLGKKTISPCAPAVADKHSGYQVGGTSPLGTKKVMPVYAEASIFELPRIYLNGGKRGFLIEVDPKDLKKVLNLVEVNASTQA